MAVRTLRHTSSQGRDRQATITGDYNVHEYDSNTTFYLDAATGAEINLPDPKEGLRYKFVVASTFTTSNWVVVSSSLNVQGQLVIAGAAVNVTDRARVRFRSPNESLGDFVEIDCDGTNWIVNGVGQLGSSIDTTT